MRSTSISPDQILYETLSEKLNAPINLTLTANRRRMISAHKDGDLYVIRLHHMFTTANPEIIEALTGWLTNSRGSRPPRVVKKFVDSIPAAYNDRMTDTKSENPQELDLFEQTPSTKSTRIITKGEIHDLDHIARKVNLDFFNGKIDSRITWGRDNSGQRVKTRRLGAYYRDDNLIVMHPVLDDPRVPEIIIAFTIFHEMLHSRQPLDHRRPHDSTFRRAEKKHPEYSFVMQWRKNYSDILNAGKSGY